MINWGSFITLQCVGFLFTRWFCIWCWPSETTFLLFILYEWVNWMILLMFIFFWARSVSISWRNSSWRISFQVGLNFADDETLKTLTRTFWIVFFILSIIFLSLFWGWGAWVLERLQNITYRSWMILACKETEEETL